MKKTKNVAWHFAPDNGKLRDGSSQAKAGKIERIKGCLHLCNHGLHWSRNPLDALCYANGSILRLVEPRGTILEPNGEDKGCSTERLIIAVMDATELCRYFARMQAISCLDNWQSDPDQIILEWLLSGDEAAWSAARSAARSAESAAESAGWSAAWSAARSAAESAGRSAGWSAAWSAARSAAWSAGRSAAWSAARNEFTQLVHECFEDFL